MKIVVRFGDQHRAVEHLMNTGINIPINYRIVTVELTPEQIKQLTPKEVSQRWDNSTKQVRPIFETREVLALET